MNAGAIAPSRAATAISRLDELNLHGPKRYRIWAWCANLTAYDAAYDAAYMTLAEVLVAPLQTMDARLVNAPGLSIPIEVFTGPTVQ